MERLQTYDVGWYVQLTLDPDSVGLSMRERTFPYCLIGKVAHLDTLNVVLNPNDVYRPGSSCPGFENTVQNYLRLLRELEARRGPDVLDLDTFRALRADADDIATRSDYMRGTVRNILETATSGRVVSLDTVIEIVRLR